MEAIRFMKTFTCNVPVWVDGQPTDEKVTRVKAMFVREVTTLGGLATAKQYGSMFLNVDVTEEQAQEVLSPDVDYSKELKFTPIEGSDFYKVEAR